MAKPQIDPDLIPKIHTFCAGETDHVTLLAVVAGELFHAVDGHIQWLLHSLDSEMQKGAAFKSDRNLKIINGHKRSTMILLEVIPS